MSNKLVRNRVVDSNNQAEIVSNAVRELRRTGFAQIFLDNGEVMVFGLIRGEILAGISCDKSQKDKADQRLIAVRDEISKAFGLTDTNYAKFEILK